MKLTTSTTDFGAGAYRHAARGRRFVKYHAHHISELALFLCLAIPASFAALVSWWGSSGVRMLWVDITVLGVASVMLTFWATMATIVLMTVWTVLVAVALGPARASLSPLSLLAVMVVALSVLVRAQRRDAVGLHRRSAESVLQDMRYQSNVQRRLPHLPPGWHAEVAHHASRGAAFAGDFVSARMLPAVGGDSSSTPDVIEGYLEIALVDVSGSGLDAGPRAIMLSGAVGGLLGAVPPAELLSNANNFVLRQGWESGFASATHLRVNLATFDYELRNAGHPPGIYWTKASGAVTPYGIGGTVLGVIEEHNSFVQSGRLAPGDAIVLFTDGVVETREYSVDEGIAQISELVVTHLQNNSPEHLAEELVKCGDRRDDRTVVVVWNDGIHRPVGTWPASATAFHMG